MSMAADANIELCHDVKRKITKLKEKIRQRQRQKQTKDQQKKLQNIEFLLEELWWMLGQHETCNDKKTKTKTNRTKGLEGL